jgi:hypothetical protein
MTRICTVQLALLVSVAACGRVGFDERGDGALGSDAAAPACSKVVFLQFEGQVLTRGPSDATKNTASWMTNATGTAPKYRATSGTRDAEIEAIVDGITQRLTSFPIAVVTTRPASGNYNMIVFGGTSQDVGSSYSADQHLDCGDKTANDVAWISDGITPTVKIVNVAIGALGLGVGLNGTSDPNDCMCGWDNTCMPNMTACTLTAGIARDPNDSQVCVGGPTQDEPAAIKASFCP